MRCNLPVALGISVLTAACAGAPRSPEVPVNGDSHPQGHHGPGDDHDHDHDHDGHTGHGSAAEHGGLHTGHGGHAHGEHGRPGEMPHRFENAEEWAKVFDEPGRDAWQKPDEVVKHLALVPGAHVADLGAGTGYFLGRLSQGVGPKGRVWGLDVEPDMARFMTERAKREGWANVEAKVVKTDDPGLAAASVDRILVVDTWHHIENRDAYVPLLVKALRPGGSLVVVDFTLDAPRGPPPKHRIAPEVIVRELTAAGLTATVVEETLPDQYIVRGVRPGS